MMSYNHPIEWLQKAYPDTYFHVEVQGDALVDRHDELVEVYPGGMLHIEAQKGRPIGMLAAPYRSADEVRAGFARLDAIGVNHHDCHQWYVDFEPQRTRELAATTDPKRPPQPRQAACPPDAATTSSRDRLMPRTSVAPEVVQRLSRQRAAGHRDGSGRRGDANWARFVPTALLGADRDTAAGEICAQIGAGRGDQSLPVSHLVLTGASVASDLSREAS